MANRIKRNTIFIECEALTNSSAFGVGELVGNYKTEHGWIATDSNGKRWLNFAQSIRNENFYKVHNQYSMQDIVWYLRERNEDYYTVVWEMLEDAVTTALEEAKHICCISDIYEYIAEHLI